MKPSKTALVCLSGGLDSAANLQLAKGNYDIQLALNFDYGQCAAEREKLSAKSFSQHYDIPLQQIDLQFLADRNSALVNKLIPTDEKIDLEDRESCEKSAADVWVANRNGAFINVAAAVAEQNGIDCVLLGFNREEAQTFSDNSAEFIEAVNNSLSFSTKGRVTVASLTIEMDKTQMVQQLAETSFPFENLWSCYLDQPQWCGTCESCKRSKRAFAAAGLNYEELRAKNAEKMASF